MKVFIDCDVAVKLAQWGLLSRFALHLQKQGRADLFTVGTLKFKFKLATPDKAAAIVGSMAAVQQLTSFVAACGVAKSHNALLAEALSDIPLIDAGEAALFAAAAEFDAAIVDTGDKKALRAVGSALKTRPSLARLGGKLACLEQTMDYLVDRWSFDTVQSAVASHAKADSSVNSCFAHGVQAKAQLTLRAKVAELTADCGPLLATAPFAWVS
ncbi:hypothetical protein [Variovorax sp.]|uniref:hypothetical protein n=1 Tax=Variovorax sp. TaxID=1871043 RepID=UPI002D309041|nr:hypothetical protein [Variovorax sp.]HYP82698.1 hypothetical protein [Variovorax sp.]